MIFNTKFRLIVFLCFIYLLFTLCESKRGGGGRRGGTYRGSSSVWSKSRQSQSGSNYDLYGSNRGKSSKNQPTQVANKASAPAETHKASAPPAPSTTDNKKATGALLDQEKNNNIHQKPIGWDTQNKNTPNSNQGQPIGWNVNRDSGNLNKQTVSNVGNNQLGQPSPISSNSGLNPPPYSPSSGQHYGNPPAYSPGSVQHNYGYPPAYNAHNYGNPPAYSYGSGSHGNPPPYSSGTPHQTYGAGLPSQYNPHQTIPNYHANTGYAPMSPQGGLYNNHMGGMNHSPMLGGNHYGGGYGGYGGQSGGIFDSHRKMGYGGYGGFGGYGVGGYGKSFGGGFGMGFGKNAYRNIAIGLLVWNLVSGFRRRPYYVYNYYNNPEKVPQEIPLPANAIVMCSDNATSLCAPNTLPLCTSQESIFCVALAEKTVPCGENSTLKCVNSTVSCDEIDNGNCKENNNKNETNSVNVPCVSSVTVTGKMNNTEITGTGDRTSFCVTTMAIPQPEEDIKKTQESMCNTNSTEVNNGTCNVSNFSIPVEVSLNTTMSSYGNNQTYPLAM